MLRQRSGEALCPGHNGQVRSKCWRPSDSRSSVTHSRARWGRPGECSTNKHPRSSQTRAAGHIMLVQVVHYLGKRGVLPTDASLASTSELFEPEEVGVSALIAYS